MEQFLRRIESCMDDFTIKKKIMILYILCVLVPLILTDSFIIYIVYKQAESNRRHTMENEANAVQHTITNTINNAAGMAKSICMNQYLNEFLEKQYKDNMEYVTDYQRMLKYTMFDTGIGIDSFIVTMYTDNDTIINGGKVGKLDEIKNQEWYRSLQESGQDRILCFFYDTSKGPSVDAKRKILFVQKMNLYHMSKIEKIVTVEINYSSMARSLTEMNYEVPIYFMKGDDILLSGGEGNSVIKNFEKLKQTEKAGYEQKLNLYGIEYEICAVNSKQSVFQMFGNNLFMICFLILINITLPMFMTWVFNRSFTVRLGELSQAFDKIEDERLTLIGNVRGKDEIGSLMRNYNKMVVRINDLILTVFKDKMQKQEMTVARQNAELLALHSQINPHFLFNALESIRMHSVLKKEFETADMVKRLATMQRQYLEWGDDLVEIAQEMEFVEAYLKLQKYRFGERLNYELEIDEDCREYKIPKLTIVTFVENACVHGIECKKNAGWIFVRNYKKDDKVYLEIEDTGNGMDEKLMEELQYKMEHVNMEMLQEKGRVGVLNACLRLKMYTGNEVQFELDGEQGMGMIVSLIMPLSCLHI